MTTFLSQLFWRRSIQRFDTAKEVSKENLDKILSAIQMAPSSYGLQPFYVRIIQNEPIKSELYAAGFNQDQFKTASHILVFIVNTADILGRVTQYFEIASRGDSEIRENNKGHEQRIGNQLKMLPPEMLRIWASKQVYIALGFGMAACAELGIDSCPMEGFSAPDFDRILDLPQQHFTTVVMSIGYRSSDLTLHPQVRFPRSDLFPDLK